MTALDEALNPQGVAAIDMLRRTGVREVQIRYSDDQAPIVWICVGLWRFYDGHVVAQGGHVRHEAAAALDPEHAVYRLLDQVMDGGQCVHCKRPSGVTHDFAGEMPADAAVCWTRYDPELNTYRRSCEGTTIARASR